MKRSLIALMLLAAPAGLGAQQQIVARDGYEAFLSAEYQGGDARHPKKQRGVLVLTDSALVLYRCRDTYCQDNEREPPFRGDPLMSFDLLNVTDVSSSSTVRGPTTAGRLALGLLATDRTEEHIGIVYETESSVEAPIFKVQRAHAAAIEAKLRFRLRRLGVRLENSDTADS